MGKWATYRNRGGSGGPGVIENYLARLAAVGGSIDAAGLAAVTALYAALARTGVWDRLGDVWPCVGANLASCVVKLKIWPGAPSVLTSVGFVGGDYSQGGASGGLTGDGATKYLTGGPTGDDLGVNCSIFVGARTALTGGGNRVFGGTLTGSDQWWLGSTDVTLNTTGRLGGVVTVAQAVAQAADYWTLSRLSATSLALFKAAASVSTTATLTAPGAEAFRAMWFAFNSTGSPGAFCAARLSGGAYGLGLTAQNVADLVSAWSQFDVTLGR